MLRLQAQVVRVKAILLSNEELPDVIEAIAIQIDELAETITLDQASDEDIETWNHLVAVHGRLVL